MAKHNGDQEQVQEKAQELPEKQGQPHFYGGQAVMEGVMMRGKTLYSMAVRKPTGEIHQITRPVSDPTKKHPWLKCPVIRGIASFAGAMVLGMKTLTESA